MYVCILICIPNALKSFGGKCILINLCKPTGEMYTYMQTNGWNVYLYAYQRVKCILICKPTGEMYTYMHTKRTKMKKWNGMAVCLWYRHMCVSIHAYMPICVCKHVKMFSSCQTYHQWRIHSCVCVCMYVSMYVCIYVCVRKHAYMGFKLSVLLSMTYPLMCVCMHVCMYVCMYICMRA